MLSANGTSVPRARLPSKLKTAQARPSSTVLVSPRAVKRTSVVSNAASTIPNLIQDQQEPTLSSRNIHLWALAPPANNFSLVRDAEAALEASNPSKAQALLNSYFASLPPSPPANNPWIKATIVQARLMALEAHSEPILQPGLMKAVELLLKAVGAARAAPKRFGHLTWNASIQYWSIVRPLLAPGSIAALIPSLSVLVKALEEREDSMLAPSASHDGPAPSAASKKKSSKSRTKDTAAPSSAPGSASGPNSDPSTPTIDPSIRKWRLRLMTALAKAQIAAGKQDEAFKTLTLAQTLAGVLNLPPVDRWDLYSLAVTATQGNSAATARLRAEAVNLPELKIWLALQPHFDSVSAAASSTAQSAAKSLSGRFHSLCWLHPKTPLSPAALNSLESELRDLKSSLITAASAIITSPAKPTKSSIRTLHLLVACVGRVAAYHNLKDLAKECARAVEVSPVPEPRVAAAYLHTVLTLGTLDNNEDLHPDTLSNDSIKLRRIVLQNLTTAVEEAVANHATSLAVDGAVMIWNTALPLLQAGHVPSLRRSFVVAADAITAAPSCAMGPIALRIHAELAKADVASESAARASAHLNAASKLASALGLTQDAIMEQVPSLLEAKSASMPSRLLLQQAASDAREPAVRDVLLKRALASVLEDSSDLAEELCGGSIAPAVLQAGPGMTSAYAIVAASQVNSGPHPSTSSSREPSTPTGHEARSKRTVSTPKSSAGTPKGSSAGTPKGSRPRSSSSHHPHQSSSDSSSMAALTGNSPMAGDVSAQARTLALTLVARRPPMKAATMSVLADTAAMAMNFGAHGVAEQAARSLVSYAPPSHDLPTAASQAEGYFFLGHALLAKAARTPAPVGSSEPLRGPRVPMPEPATQESLGPRRLRWEAMEAFIAGTITGSVLGADWIVNNGAAAVYNAVVVDAQPGAFVEVDVLWSVLVHLLPFWEKATMAPPTLDAALLASLVISVLHAASRPGAEPKEKAAAIAASTVALKWAPSSAREHLLAALADLGPDQSSTTPNPTASLLMQIEPLSKSAEVDASHVAGLVATAADAAPDPGLGFWLRAAVASMLAKDPPTALKAAAAMLPASTRPISTGEAASLSRSLKIPAPAAATAELVAGIALQALLDIPAESQDENIREALRDSAIAHLVAAVSYAAVDPLVAPSRSVAAAAVVCLWSVALPITGTKSGRERLLEPLSSVLTIYSGPPFTSRSVQGVSGGTEKSHQQLILGTSEDTNDESRFALSIEPVSPAQLLATATSSTRSAFPVLFQAYREAERWKEGLSFMETVYTRLPAATNAPTLLSNNQPESASAVARDTAATSTTLLVQRCIFSIRLGLPVAPLLQRSLKDASIHECVAVLTSVGAGAPDPAAALPFFSRAVALVREHDSPLLQAATATTVAEWMGPLAPSPACDYAQLAISAATPVSSANLASLAIRAYSVIMVRSKSAQDRFKSFAPALEAALKLLSAPSEIFAPRLVFGALRSASVVAQQDGFAGIAFELAHVLAQLAAPATASTLGLIAPHECGPILHYTLILEARAKAAKAGRTLPGKVPKLSELIPPTALRMASKEVTSLSEGLVDENGVLLPLTGAGSLLSLPRLWTTGAVAAADCGEWSTAQELAAHGGSTAAKAGDSACAVMGSVVLARHATHNGAHGAALSFLSTALAVDTPELTEAAVHTSSMFASAGRLEEACAVLMKMRNKFERADPGSLASFRSTLDLLDLVVAHPNDTVLSAADLSDELRFIASVLPHVGTGDAARGAVVLARLMPSATTAQGAVDATTRHLEVAGGPSLDHPAALLAAHAKSLFAEALLATIPKDLALRGLTEGVDGAVASEAPPRSSSRTGLDDLLDRTFGGSRVDEDTVLSPRQVIARDTAGAATDAASAALSLASASQVPSALLALSRALVASGESLSALSALHKGLKTQLAAGEWCNGVQTALAALPLALSAVGAPAVAVGYAGLALGAQVRQQMEELVPVGGVGVVGRAVPMDWKLDELINIAPKSMRLVSVFVENNGARGYLTMCSPGAVDQAVVKSFNTAGLMSLVAAHNAWRARHGAALLRASRAGWDDAVCRAVDAECNAALVETVQKLSDLVKSWGALDWLEHQKNALGGSGSGGDEATPTPTKKRSGAAAASALKKPLIELVLATSPALAELPWELVDAWNNMEEAVMSRDFSFVTLTARLKAQTEGDKSKSSPPVTYLMDVRHEGAGVGPLMTGLVSKNKDWVGVLGGRDAVPSAGTVQRLLVKGGVQVIGSFGRALDTLGSSAVSGIEMDSTRLAVIADQGVSDGAYRRLARVSVNQAAAAAAERARSDSAWTTAAVWAMRGVPAVVSHLWAVTPGGVAWTMGHALSKFVPVVGSNDASYTLPVLAKSMRAGGPAPNGLEGSASTAGSSSRKMSLAAASASTKLAEVKSMNGPDGSTPSGPIWTRGMVVIWGGL